MATVGLAAEIKKRRPFACREQEAMLSVLRTAAVLSEPFDRLFRAYELSMPAYNILRILRGESPHGLTCSEIRSRMISRVPDTTRLIDRLEKRSLVQRRRSSTDRRQVTVTISDRGLTLIDPLDDEVIELHRATLGNLSTSEIEQLLTILSKIRTQTDFAEGNHHAIRKGTC